MKILIIKNTFFAFLSTFAQDQRINKYLLFQSSEAKIIVPNS